MNRPAPAVLVHRRADGAEERFVLHQGTMTIGRSDTCQIIIRAPMVSRTHANIEHQQGHYVLVDMNSANGVFVNGRRLSQRQQLRDGDEIWLGSSDAVLSVSLPAERPAPPASVGTPPQPLKDIRETNIVNAMTSTSFQKNPDALFTTRLPVLQVALNVEHMTGALQPLLAPLAAAGAAPRVRYAKLLTYKQGNRGLIHYELDAARGAVVYGKLYPDPAQASRMHRVLRALWDNGFGDDPQVGVPRPLGFLPDLSILVYVPADGRFLAELAGEERAEHFAGLVGRWLASLHRGRLPLDKQFQPGAEQVHVQSSSSLIAHKFPDMADTARHIAGELGRRLAGLRLDTATPTHGDLHYGHVVVGQKLSVVDFDELRGGDPNLDLGHFCAYLTLLAHRQDLTQLQQARFQNAFLSSYAAGGSWSPNERYAYFYGSSCLKIARLLCSMRGLRPRPEGAEQQRQVRLVLDRAQMVLNAPLH